jgi:hypothetical protein
MTNTDKHLGTGTPPVQRHPQEIALVIIGAATGLAIPTRHFEPMKLEAERLGADHCHAFNAQVARQSRP